MSKPSKAVATAAGKDIFDMPLDELQKRVETAHGHIQQVIDLFPGLITLTEEERRHTSGRIRKGEGGMFLAVLSIIESFPHFFEGLSDLDGGVDPNKVEVELMRDRVQRAELLAPLSDLTEKLTGLSDTVLHLRAKVREPISQAYGIAKVMAKTNQALRSKLAPVIDFYASIAKTRKANGESKGQAKS